MVWKGGLASHGALVGILAGVWLYSRRATDQSFLWVCDRIGMSAPFSGCLIRIGNFFNSEILGRPTDLPGAVTFPRVDLLPRHPVRLYKAFCYLLIFLYQFRYYLNRAMPGPRVICSADSWCWFSARVSSWNSSRKARRLLRPAGPSAWGNG